MTDFIVINIDRPVPETDENERQIAFIEPLRKDNRIQVPVAYRMNLDSFYDGKPCTWSPGFRYEFGFYNLEDATAFKLKFGGVEVVDRR